MVTETENTQGTQGASRQAITREMAELRNHVLTETYPVGEDSTLRVFRMCRPDMSRMMSVLIVFTPENIVITGDLCPRTGTNGVISDYGYGMGWFASDLSPDYLCSKFMRHVWQADAAAAWCRRFVHEYETGQDMGGLELARDIQNIRDLAVRLDDHGMGEEHFSDEIRDILPELEETPGYAYPVADAAWLVAIQLRFRELYAQLQIPNTLAGASAASERTSPR